MRRIAVAVLSAFGIARALVACSGATPPPATVREDEDAESGPGDAAVEASPPNDADGGAPSCALPGLYGSKACMACVAARCCDRVTACEGAPACKALQRCTLDCLPKPDGGGCYATCQATHADGKPLWQPVYDCWFGTPPDGCLIECT